MIEPPYRGGDERIRYKPDYRSTSRDRAVARYEAMLEADWLDNPLRELLETRVDTLLEGGR